MGVTVREEVKNKFGIEVSISYCRRAKKYVFTLVEGTIINNYAKLWSYGENIRRSNPSSIVKPSIDAICNVPIIKAYFSLKHIRV